MNDWYKVFGLVRFPMSLVPLAVFALGMKSALGSWALALDHWLILVAAGFISFAAFSINDYRDRFIDVRKGKDFAYRNRRAAKLIAWSCSVVGMILAALSGSNAFLVLLFFTIASIFYSTTFANIALLKNGMASLLSAILLIGGAWTVGSPTVNLWVLAAIIFCIVFGRELVKDIEDVKVDAVSRRTLAHVFSDRTLTSMIFFCLFVETASLFVLFHQPLLFLFLYVAMLLAFFIGWLMLPKKFEHKTIKKSAFFFHVGLWLGAASMVFLK